MPDYTRIQNDTGPPIRDVLQTDGTPDDLSESTVRFTMWEPSGTVVIERNDENVTVQDTTDGAVRYDFDTEDLAQTGLYYFEWEVEWASTTITYRKANGRPKELEVLAEGA